MGVDMSASDPNDKGAAMNQKNNPSEHDLPKLSAPAQRALAAAGVHRLKDLTKFSEGEVGKWHGIGPNAMGQLRRALKEQGLSFRDYSLTR
jgi:hypothetical protein